MWGSKHLRGIAGVGLTLLLSACSGAQGKMDAYFSEFGLTGQTPNDFKVCWNHDCREVAQVSFDQAEWARIATFFQTTDPTTPTTPEGERAMIQDAIGQMEQMVGTKTGTRQDLGGSFKGLGKDGQMDCVDEMLNTANYLRMMEETGLIKFHHVVRRVTNGFDKGGWPHTATVIEDLERGDRFVVDSWWLSNGEPPFMVPLDIWLKGGWFKAWESARSPDGKVSSHES